MCRHSAARPSRAAGFSTEFSSLASEKRCRSVCRSTHDDDEPGSLNTMRRKRFAASTPGIARTRVPRRIPRARRRGDGVPAWGSPTSSAGSPAASRKLRPRTTRRRRRRSEFPARFPRSADAIPRAISVGKPTRASNSRSSSPRPSRCSSTMPSSFASDARVTIPVLVAAARRAPLSQRSLSREDRRDLATRSKLITPSPFSFLARKDPPCRPRRRRRGDHDVGRLR